MLFIFNDKRRGPGPFSSNPVGDGAIFSLGCVAEGLSGPTTQHHLLLTQAKNRSRHGGAIYINRPSV